MQVWKFTTWRFICRGCTVLIFEWFVLFSTVKIHSIFCMYQQFFLPVAKQYSARHWSCSSFLFCSVAHSCPTLCNPMDCSMPGFPVLHHLLELAQTYVHWVGNAIQPSLSSVVPFSSHLHSFPASGSFPMSWLFASDDQSIGASASASVLPMNIQGWLPLVLTGLISWLSKGLSRVFSNTTIQKHQFFDTQLSV